MSTSFNSNLYTNGGYNPGIPSQGQFNYQPFMVPPQNPISAGSGTYDPLSQYFGSSSSSGMDSFQSGNSLGLGSGSSSLFGLGGESPTSGNALLGRFQAMANKLDTEVNPQSDGKIDTNDLETALNDNSGKFNGQDKQVIQSLIDDTSLRGKLDHMDGQDDGTINIDSINKLVVNPDAKQQTPENKMTNTEALSTMADYMGTAIHLNAAGHRADKYVDKHGKLVASQRGAWTTDRSKLEKMSKDEQVPENVRTAAKKLLENDQLLKTVDTAHKGGNPDGKYSLKDFQDAIKNNPDIDSLGTSETDPSMAAKSESSNSSGSTSGGEGIPGSSSTNSIQQPSSLPLDESGTGSSSGSSSASGG